MICHELQTNNDSQEFIIKITTSYLRSSTRTVNSHRFKHTHCLVKH